MKEQHYRYYEFGEFRLDAYERVLLKEGEPVALTYKVFEVLLALVESHGRILEKEELMQRVWADAMVEESNLKNSISALRKALGDAPGASRYIQTLPKRGYRLVAEVIALPDADETYIVERHTTAEIVVETISEDDATSTSENHTRLNANSSPVIEAWSTAIDALPPATGESAGPITATKAPAAQLLPGRVSFSERIKRNKWAAGIGLGVLVVGIAALATGVYRWTRQPKSSLAFEKMKMARLTNVGNGPAVISPDGKYIAYLMSGTPTDGLWVKQTATDSAVKLLPLMTFWGMQFSRDSNFVYYNFADGNYPEGALYKIPVLGGPPKLVLSDIAGGVGFSPDGKRMVFKRLNKEWGKPDLLSANVDGSDERVILPANARHTVWLFDWSPDGKRIAISVINDPVEGQLTWQVKEIPATGGDEKTITAPQKESLTSLVWLPDGSGLIVNAADQATGLPQLWHLAYPGGQATRITNDSNLYGLATMTADGETILAQRSHGSANLWAGDASDLNQLRKLTADSGSCDEVSWTPDGRILYSEGDNGISELWAINADGTGRARLTNDQSQNRWPMMSPDGRTLVYSSKRGGQQQIWRMDSDGRNARALTDWPEGADQPRVTLDNQFVICVARQASLDWTLRKIPIAGGEFVLLAGHAGKFVISPDGKRVAYNTFDEQKKRRVIAVKPLDGGEPPKVFDYPDFPIFRIEQWTQDGLLCTKSDSTQVILIPVDGSPPRQLTNFKTGDRIYSFAVSADGRQFAFAIGMSTSETLMITNFKKQ